eukprot:scpid106644/ scgid7401/ 
MKKNLFSTTAAHVLTSIPRKTCMPETSDKHSSFHRPPLTEPGIERWYKTRKSENIPSVPCDCFNAPHLPLHSTVLIDQANLPLNMDRDSSTTSITKITKVVETDDAIYVEETTITESE